MLCGGVIGYRALRRSGVQHGGRLGLFGYGASAHLALQVAVHWGCQVYVFTRSKEEKKRALETGAAWAGGYDSAAPVLLDAAVTFAPVGDVIPAALRSVDRGGVAAINAIHLDRVPEFSYDLLWGERELRSVANFTRRDAEEFLQLAQEIPIHTAVQVFPLDSANEALHLLKSGSLGGTAVLIVE
jgi:propanol-preferring alcohol dehydrogenase